MHEYQSESGVGDVMTLKILNGHVSEKLMHLLLTQGIEISVSEILDQSVKLVVRAPGEVLVVEELALSVA